GVDCRAGELDIEPVISGADTMVYCAVGINYNSHAWSTMIVANIGTGAGAGYTWSFGGYNDASVNYYNPKVTSDNTNYTTASYIYMTSSFDSAGTVKYTSRFLVVTTGVFSTSPTFTYRQPNAGIGFWWNSNGTPATYLYQDICYYNTGSNDRIYTVYNHSGAAQGQTVYISWSNDYGVTVGAGNTTTLVETANVLGAICASNGGTSQSVLLGYRRFFNPDWDYRVQYSATGGVTGGSFTASYIEFTTDTTLLISMQAVDLGNGRFVTGHARNGGEHFYRKFNSNTLSSEFQTNNITGDVGFGGCRAGYWASQNADSCMVVWSGTGGASAYCSRLICTTVGIQSNSNEIPEVYSLSQNYPNPFNPVTNIKFSIPTGGMVKLTIFDITGREVTSLVNQNLNAGSYTADFDASQLSSGIYFYTLSSGSFTETKKMMLVK
ncbi:MAG: T9SS type A sorting domain-containing protein, partial [Ignavibacteria bacterium]